MAYDILKKMQEFEIDRESVDFTTLIGYSVHIRKMASLHAAARLPQVLLIEGRQGLGKRVFAAAVASLPFCKYGVGCGTCEGCCSVIDNRNPDIFWLEKSDESIKIDDIKQLQDHLSMMPSLSGFNSLFSAGEQGGARRIVVIVDADKMTDQAANRFLKTMEEPSEYAMIILTTSRVRSMLPTVLSRLVRWQVAPPNAEESIEFLKRRLSEQGVLDKVQDKLEWALMRSGFAPGHAFKLLLQLDDANENEIHENLRQLLFSGNTLSVLDTAEYLAKEMKLSIEELLQRIELELNSCYRTTFNDGLSIRHNVIIERRRVIKELRRYAVKAKIALNTQLCLENIGFCMGDDSHRGR